jgi:signal transduction histidine kinase
LAGEQDKIGIEFTSAVRQAAMDTLSERLRELRSPLIESGQAADQLRYQLGSVLDDVEGIGDPAAAGELRAARLSEEIGVTRAMRGVHPVESVRAAIEMFQVLLPVVILELRAHGGGEALIINATEVLNRAIMRRVGFGAVSYASYLLKKVNNSHRDERTRIGRELHDRAAHSIGVALQNLELHDAYLSQDPDRARRKIDGARDMLLDALLAVRETAQELRDSTTEHGGLYQAVSNYAEWHVPTDIDVVVAVSGDVTALPLEVSEELYIVVREAIRNAVRHASPRTIRVDVEVRDGKTSAKVEDDGSGFDVAMTPTGIGLLSMSERIELLGGALMITSNVGDGTIVSITVPVTAES